VSENLDLVRSIYADLGRGDFFGRTREWAEPEIACVFVGGSEPGTWTGLAAVEETMRDRLSAWDAAYVTAEQYRELDDERVLVLFSIGGIGKTSGLDLAQTPTRAAQVFHVRDGKVTRIVSYWDPDRALADLGLEE
jgi:ketosteroid isomerase-like protein